MGLTYMYAYADCTRLQYQIKGRWFLYLFTLFISTAIIHIIYIYILENSQFYRYHQCQLTRHV